MTCIENMARIQHRQLNYQSHTCHNFDMLINTFDLWWLKLSEGPPNPASIPPATSLAREWLAEAIISHSILTLSGWWAGRQGFQTGTVGWLCYQGRCQIIEAWESVTWILLVVTQTCSLLADWATPSDSWPKIPIMSASTKVKVREKICKSGRTPKDEVDNAWWYFIHDHMYIKYNVYHYQIIKPPHQ